MSYESPLCSTPAALLIGGCQSRDALHIRILNRQGGGVSILLWQGINQGKVSPSFARSLLNLLIEMKCLYTLALYISIPAC